MATAKKPVIIAIPGAWHPAACLHKVQTPLESLGYTVRGLTLASVNASPPLTSIQPDMDLIRAAVAAEVDRGHDVLVVTHSYSGVPANAALGGLLKPERSSSGKAGGVRAIAMMASFALLEDEALGDQNDPTLDLVPDVEGKTCTVEKENCVRYFYNDCDRAEAERWADQLKPQSLAVFFEKTPQRRVWRDVDLHYLVCERDQAIYGRKQHFMVDRIIEEKGGKGVVKEVCDAGHSPFLSQPERVVKFLRRAAGEAV